MGREGRGEEGEAEERGEEEEEKGEGEKKGRGREKGKRRGGEGRELPRASRMLGPALTLRYYIAKLVMVQLQKVLVRRVRGQVSIIS